MNRRIPLYSALLLAAAAICLTAVSVSVVFRFRSGTVGEKTAAVERLLDKVYVGEYNKTQAADAAAAAVIASTEDPWSYYVPADQYDAYMESASNTYTGLGVTLEQRQGESSVKIAAVAPDGPADIAGILAGDRLLSIDGAEVDGRSIQEIRQMLREKNGQEVLVGLERAGERLQVKVLCGTVQSEVSFCAMLDDRVGYLRILNFEADCSRQTLDCISRLLQQGAEAMIFDVRSNPGGKRTELVSVLDHLLPEGILFRSVDSSGKEQVDRSDEICLRIPMAVLVNGDSYSASEFFAAALQEYDWAEVVGEKTMGKGNYQILYRFSDGSAAGISSGSYYTPKGINLEGIGVTPDLEVSLDSGHMATVTEGTVSCGGDEQLMAAWELLKEKLLQK